MSEVSLPITVGDSPLDEAHPVTHSQQTMTQLTTPLDANLLGNVFGGVVLAAVDKIAYVCAARHAGRTCVTASFDQVDFRSPIHVGEMLTLLASVNFAGRTSLEIGVRVTSEPVFEGESRHTNSCYVTMVAIDDRGRPVPVPKLILEDELQYRRYQDALERRRARLKLAADRRRRWKGERG